MANKWVGAAAGLVGGQVVGKALSVFLSSRTGEQVMESIDHRSLTPLEHRVLAQRWSGNIGKALSGATAALFVLQRDGEGAGSISAMGGRNVNWVEVVKRTGEILLALGAIFRVVGEFLEDRERTATESQREAARRLA
jgi:hypothetical protein